VFKNQPKTENWKRMDTPASLLERLRQPAQHDAWPRFVELYTPLLYSWARRAGLQEADAADLVQDVFALLVHKLPEFSYDQHKSFRGWLRTVTLNKWREIQRRGQHQPLAKGANLAALPADDEAEALWEDEHRRHLVGRALEIMRGDFKPATWQACWQVVVEGRSAAEVAAELGLTIGAVHAARFRVLARLRHELQGLLD
jgi:RNA polymerase sigma-70 factor (ECF subfamily)